MELSQIRGERVVLRVDINVPIENGIVTAAQRLRAIIPTIRQLRKQGNSLIIISHLGRPEGRQKRYSLKPVAQALSDLIGVDIIFSADVLSKRTAQLAAGLEPSQVLMLENLRYYPEEEANDAAFAKHLASLGTVYVNDAFSVCHRSHASVVGIPKHLPAAFGITILAELDALERMKKPKHPSVAIVGGAKISTKLGLLESLSNTFDTVIVGGAMAFTLLKAQGYEIGRSKVEPTMIVKAKRLLAHPNIILPVDAIVARSVSPHARAVAKGIDAFDPEDIGLDIGPETVALIVKSIRSAKSIVWNGPLGLFELKPFAKGSAALARALAQSKAHVVVGGGDTVALIEQMRLLKRYDHVSTAGGAMLEYLEFGTLPGVEAVTRARAP